ncbi:DNA-3-methyladenine glycosylase I [Marinomonas pollencensis]|uniref:DNA-3-methyladenine glycosylase I n=1 Tax=Marinomonas pollencensis TaxID=491954 RepID=A0A3E0DMX4_9GAMM|nr:DNA-3-methyladenine glycosylase I [Marinomonas pollencensis]REG84180.1 DNA-3-methyladenine glycosylase I [Marinomonas pollencensis]
MQYEPFQTIYERAALRHGGQHTLEQQLTKPASSEQLCQHSDDRWLAAFSQKIFQSGINWQVVRNKWEGFESVFFGFDIEKMLLIHDEMWEEKAKDPRIIRHLGKVMTIRENALMIHECQLSHGSFAKFIADWPSHDIIGLWLYLKQHGKRLGGNTGPYTLRIMGKDTFLMTRDVEGYLRLNEIISTGKDTKSALLAAQAAFNHWQKESGRSLNEISQCIAMSVN